MRDLLVVATFEHKESGDFEGGSAVALNGHLIYYWDSGMASHNHTERIVNRLKVALDPIVEKVVTPIKAWWDDQEIEACLIGLMIPKYKWLAYQAARGGSPG